MEKDTKSKMNKMLSEQFAKLDQAIKANPERARKITENSSSYVKDQVEKIIEEKKK